MHLILILLSIWYLIGLVTGIAITYLDWRDGRDVQLWHIPATFFAAIGGPGFALLVLDWSWCEDLLHRIGDYSLIRGRKP